MLVIGRSYLVGPIQEVGEGTAKQADEKTEYLVEGTGDEITGTAGEEVGEITGGTVGEITGDEIIDGAAGTKLIA